MININIRRLEADDLEYRVAWYNNPLIFNQVYLDIPFSLSDTKEWFKRNTLNNSRKDFSFDYCVEKNSPVLIAMGGLVNIDFQHRRAERYFLLDPSFQKKGIGFRLLNWICNFGFIHFNLNKIYGTSIDNNEAILKTNKKEGWVHEGTLRQNIFYNGRFVDQHIKSILRSEWENKTWKTEHIAFNIPITF